MAFMTWDEIRAATGGRLLLGKMRGNDAFAGITTDTRKVQAGDLFVALRGEKFDGADFAAGALRAGAVAVMLPEPVSDAHRKELDRMSGAVIGVPDTLAAYQQIAHAWRMKFDIPVVAVTGSNGKTTTTTLTHLLLKTRYENAGLGGNIGIPLSEAALAVGAGGVIAVEMAHEHQIEVPGADAPLLQLLVDGSPLGQVRLVDRVLVAQVGHLAEAAAVDRVPAGVDEGQAVAVLDQVGAHRDGDEVIAAAEGVGPGQRRVPGTVVGQRPVDDDSAGVEDLQGGAH